VGAPGVYIHVPFCKRVCPYCDFAVQTGGPKKRDAYVQSLLREIHWWGAGESGWRNPEPFDTVYLGGGTPSSLALDDLERVLTTLRSVLSVDEDAEITLEANPEDVSVANVAAWRALGVSRLSLGVQAFDDAALEVLGREHTAEQAATAAQRSLAAGFDAVSLDVIFAVPGQTPEEWRSTLQYAVDLQPHHISCYELTVHQGTRFFRARQQGRFAEVTDDDKAEQFFFTHRYLADAGYPAYEVSNFARAPGQRSQHNAKYWDHTAYLGLGPSAHSFDGRHTRWWNERRLIDWQAALDEHGRAIREEEALAPEQLVLESLALGLRTTAGVDLERIDRRYGVDLEGTNGAVIKRLVGDGYLATRSDSRLVPTLEGLAIADTLALQFEVPASTHKAVAETPVAEAARGSAVLPGGRQ